MQWAVKYFSHQGWFKLSISLLKLLQQSSVMHVGLLRRLHRSTDSIFSLTACPVVRFLAFSLDLSNRHLRVLILIVASYNDRFTKAMSSWPRESFSVATRNLQKAVQMRKSVPQDAFTTWQEPWGRKSWHPDLFSERTHSGRQKQKIGRQ